MTDERYEEQWMIKKIERVCGYGLASAIRALPEHMRHGAAAYVVHGQPVGDFLTAVLMNDLKESAGRADNVNAGALFQWAAFLYHLPVMPVKAYGSRENIRAWLEAGGLMGLLGQQQAEEAKNDAQ